MKREKQNELIQRVMASALTADEKEITAIQKVLSALGWQWQEHIFNDGHSNCYLTITKDTDPCILGKTQGDAGWGRFGRLYCWREALEWAKSH